MYRPLPCFVLLVLTSSPVVRSQAPSTTDREPKPCEIWGQIVGSVRLLKKA